MIDWITIRIPCSHATPINGGKFVSISSDGEEEWNTDKFLPVEGSYSSKISIRSLSTDIITDNNRFTHIELSGNPVKFLQGHNIWGTDSLLDLILNINNILYTYFIFNNKICKLKNIKIQYYLELYFLVFLQ